VLGGKVYDPMLKINVNKPKFVAGMTGAAYKAALYNEAFSVARGGQWQELAPRDKYTHCD